MEKVFRYIKWYADLWQKIIARPILFYTVMPREDWKEEPLTFITLSSWILGLALTIAIFITQYVPIGKYLLEGLSGVQLVIVSPVTVTLAFVFFAMTYIIVGGFLMGALIFLLVVCGAIEHYILKLIGGKGDLKIMINAFFYSGAVFIFGLLPSLLAILTKWHFLNFWQFRISENLIYYFSCLYIYGLWSIAGRKIHDVPRWKAFVGAVIPVLILVAINVVLSSKILPRIENLFL